MHRKMGKKEEGEWWAYWAMKDMNAMDESRGRGGIKPPS